MTDYAKWSRVDFKQLGCDSSDEENSAESAYELHARRQQEAAAAEERLKVLEKEQALLEQRLAEAQAKSKRTDFFLKLSFVGFSVVVMIAHYFVSTW